MRASTCVQPRRRRLSLRRGRPALPGFRLGDRGHRARPCPPPSGGRTEGSDRQGLARLEPVSRPGAGAVGRPTGRAFVRRYRVLLQLGRPRRTRPASRCCASTKPKTAIPSASASSRSRAPSTVARSRRSRPPARRNTSRASGRRPRASIRSRSATSTNCAPRSPRRPRASWPNRSRAKAASARPAPNISRRCARSPTSSACC